MCVRMSLVRFASILVALLSTTLTIPAQVPSPPGGRSVLAGDALLVTPVGGLERTQATANVVQASGVPSRQALRVTVRANAVETNATQLTMPITSPVAVGDVMLASFYVRGSTPAGSPGQVEVLFERVVDPWTKSVTHDVSTSGNAGTWKRVFVPFTAAESYRPGEAMVSIRFAFGLQTVEIAGLRVEDYAKRSEERRV